MQKTYILTVTLIGVLVVCGSLFANSAFAAQQTFSWPDIVQFLPGGGDWSAYCADTATATQFCKIKGFDSYVNYGQRYIGPRLDNDYVLQWNGSAFAQVGGLGCSTVIDPSITCTKSECTSHASKKCSGNDVYWYDSCGNRQELVKECTGNQTCQNGECVNVTCSSNSDCGTNGYTGSPFCQGNSVYQNYITYTCSNAGTAQSHCSNSTEAKLKQNCSSSQTCSNGSCSDQNITCSSNSDCGTDAYTGLLFCQGNDVYQNYIKYTCQNPGTSASSCSNSTIAKLKQNCSGSQNCMNGSCSANCTSHSYQQCSGDTLYWYDSCGNRQDGQYCSNGCYNNSCQYNNNVTVQSNPATNVYNNQATLNGYLYNYNNNNNNNYDYNHSCNTYVWFQYGPTSSYGYETNRQTMNNSGAFSQIINTYSGNVYHFRAAAQTCSGNIVYGQDLTTSSATGGYMTVNKTVRNLTSGSGWASSVSAAPLDMLMFMITLQANSGQDVQNVVVRDYLPSNLIYNNQLVVACTGGNNYYNNCGSNYNYTGNISSGVNLNTIYGGQTVTITYQTQVASAQNFSYGTTTLTNNVSVTSSSGSNSASNASVIVNRTGVYGASTISTGLTNNFWVDSFFLPLAIALLAIWLWRSGIFFGIEKWLDNKKKGRRGYKSEKELNKRIALIQRAEKAL